MWRIPFRVKHHNINQLISAFDLGTGCDFEQAGVNVPVYPLKGHMATAKLPGLRRNIYSPRLGRKKWESLGKFPISRPTLAKFNTFFSWPSSSLPSSLTDWMIDWWRCNPKELPFFGYWQDIIGLTTFEQFWSKFTILIRIHYFNHTLQRRPGLNFMT